MENWPFSSWSARWAAAEALGSWVTMMMVFPWSLARVLSRARMESADWRSRSPVGSSATRSSGSWTMARAMATRCSCPPESSAGRWSARSLRPTRSRAARIFFLRSDLLRFPRRSGSSMFS